MNTKDLVDLGLLVLIWTICVAYVAYQRGWQEGHRCGRVDEHGDNAARVLNAKKEAMLAERQRLFSPSNISKT